GALCAAGLLLESVLAGAGAGAGADAGAAAAGAGAGAGAGWAAWVVVGLDADRALGSHAIGASAVAPTTRIAHHATSRARCVLLGGLPLRAASMSLPV